MADFRYHVGLLLLFSALACPAQPKSDLAPPPPLDPVEGQRQARALVAHLLEQRPELPVTNSGTFKIRDKEGNQREVSVQFEVLPTPTNWLNVYDAATSARLPGAKLAIIHSDEQPNQYSLSEPERPGAPSAGPRKLASNEVMAPFAGSDFWMADLGLEFLHWPQQRVLRKQMRKGLFCDVLQSTAPQPFPAGYSRVVSWIAINRPEDIVIVHAEAFDLQNQLLKEFDPKKVEKVNGIWQLEEMEIRNRQTGSRTRVDFNLDGP